MDSWPEETKVDKQMKESKLLCIVHSQMLPYAKQCLEKLFPDEKKDFFTAEELKNNLGSLLKQIRKSGYQRAIFFCYDLQTKKKLEKWKALLLLSGGKEKLVIDWSQSLYRVAWPRFLVQDLPRLVAESCVSPLVLLYHVFLSRKLLFFAKRERGKPGSNPFSKICYLRTDHWFGIKAGGSVTHISGVANGFSGLGYRLFFISTDKLEMIDNKRTPLFLLKPSPFFRNSYEIPEMAYNSRLIKTATQVFGEEKPTLIYQRYSVNNYSGIVLSRKFKLPFVLEYNGSEVWIARNWGQPFRFEKIAEKIELANLQTADLVVVVSQPMKDTLLERGIEGDKILVNPNGVDIERLNPDIDGSEIENKYKLKGQVVVGFIGTFGKWHGADFLAGAVKFIVEQNPNIRFLFVGDGLTMAEVKNIIKKDNLEEFVVLSGIVPQEDAPKYLAACDILASPHLPMEDGSEFFGSPTKLFEYMAMGKGIVASNIGQIGKVLRHNENAILVEPGSKRELAEGILELAQNKMLREKLGIKAREDAIANYTWQKNVERVIRACEELIEKDGQGRQDV